MRKHFVLVALISCLGLAFAPACGGDDGDDGGGTPDAAGTPDAGGTPDAPVENSALGRTCTGMGQGDCPAGFECLNLQGGSAAWCSKRCTDQADPVCGEGYTGTGFPACFLGIDSNGDGAVDFNACGVICQDLAGGICPAENTCDGTCPGMLACTGPVQGGGGMQVATACQ